MPRKHGAPWREPSALKQTAEREAAEAEQQAPPAAEPETAPEEGKKQETATTGDDTETGEEIEEKGPLSKLQDSLRELLDYDQLTEVRLALKARREDLAKHRKKGTELGVYEQDAQRRLFLLDGDDTRFGLIRIFEREQATETRDLFFDREKANGRPDSALDGTITFHTVDGQSITCTLEQLELADKIVHLRALHTAGILPEYVEKAIRDGDFWHLIEDENEAHRALAEAGGVPA